jgi:hypothetical protein
LFYTSENDYTMYMLDLWQVPGHFLWIKPNFTQLYLFHPLGHTPPGLTEADHHRSGCHSTSTWHTLCKVYMYRKRDLYERPLRLGQVNVYACMVFSKAVILILIAGSENVKNTTEKSLTPTSNYICFCGLSYCLILLCFYRTYYLWHFEYWVIPFPKRISKVMHGQTCTIKNDFLF